MKNEQQQRNRTGGRPADTDAKASETSAHQPSAAVDDVHADERHLHHDVRASQLDNDDPLAPLKELFLPYPTRCQVYLAGHSLGLMPASTPAAVKEQLDKWQASGVRGHFEQPLPWAQCEEALTPLLGDLVGAARPEIEVAAMNSLTVNLHLLMAAFYRPSAGRAAILIEAGAFPSDRYAVASQIKHHGYPVPQNLIEVRPASADGVFTEAELTGAIRAHSSRLCLVLLGGVNYLTGQVLPMRAIARCVAELNAGLTAPAPPASAAAPPQGGRPILLGYDLAHAVGNVPVSLHEWGVDFGAWCSYKYLNGGAGAIGGIFVHERHAVDVDEYPRLAGWWGVPHAPGPRFEMRHAFEPADGAPGFACSNANPLAVACLLESLRTFERAGGIRATREKSVKLTAYLDSLLRAETSKQITDGWGVRIVTPNRADERGAQLSLRVLAPAGAVAPPGSMRELERILQERGVVCDAREPDIVRVALVPLYNSFRDAAVFASELGRALRQMGRPNGA